MTVLTTSNPFNAERKLPWVEARTSVDLADVLRKRRDFEGAITLYKAALEMHESEDDDDKVGQNAATGEGVYKNHFGLGVCYKNLGHRCAASRLSHLRI